MYTEEINLYLDEFKEELDKATNHLQNELLQIRAGRANPKILDRVIVDYYGTATPLTQMATVSVPEARMLLVSMWDVSMLKTAVKAIQEANLGVNPSDDGKVIRLVFPQLTEERRKEFVKDIKKLTENAKITCRNARRDVLDVFKKMKKDNTITEDEMSSLEKDVQKILDECVSNIDNMSTRKEKDIMEI